MKGLHHSQHRRLDVGLAEGGQAVMHRQCRYSYQGDADVDQDDDRRAGQDQALERPARAGNLADQTRGGLQPGERDDCDRQRERQIGPGRCGAEVDGVGEVLGVKRE